MIIGIPSVGGGQRCFVFQFNSARGGGELGLGSPVIHTIADKQQQ